jgi:hypothetical protein
MPRVRLSDTANRGCLGRPSDSTLPEMSAGILTTTPQRRLNSIRLMGRGIESKEYAPCRTVLPFKYRPIVARSRHRRDAADRIGFLALSIARPRYVNRATHSLPRPREVMASRSLSMRGGSH